MKNITSDYLDKKKLQLIKTIVTYIVLVSGIPIVMTPFIWMISTSLKSVMGIFEFPPKLIPDPILWQNYVELFTESNLHHFILNSIFIAGSVVFLEILTSSLSAYAFARLKFPWRDRIFLLYLGTLMIPSQVTIIPAFILIAKFKWLDTFSALIIPAAFTAFGTFLLRQHFMAIPDELTDAAKMDGASHLRIYWSVILPLSKPAIATLSVLAFMAQWNSFLWPLIVTFSERVRPLTLALRYFQSDPTTIGNPGKLLAGATISVIPILLIFLLAQKHFIRGITISGIGGR